MQAFFESVSIEQWLAIVSGVIALVSFFLNLSLVARQEKRNRVAMKMAHDSDVIAWSNEVVRLLASAQEMLVEKGMSYNDAEFRGRRSGVRADLSALIDRGRLFFPNREDGDYGKEKEAGFQGRRHPALDVLVDAYAIIDAAGSAPGPDGASSEKLTSHRRKFMAEIFTSVDPVRRGQNMKELT
ncbi:MAG: hypothetical protein RIR33_172 [Pseudomonadota bacterium]|jgi:hypothetical protein